MGLSTPPLTHADSLKAKYAGKGWTTDRLKKVLKANHQPFKTLNKTALIACCVDIELKGALPQCPKCSDTLPDGCKPPLLIAASPSGYRCEGYLDAKKDDHIDCSAGGKLTDAQVREPPRAVRLESAREREREREWSWWAHTGGGKASAFKYHPRMRRGDAIPVEYRQGH
jgi:hypothetical protein